jgi:adenylate cyclase class 2
MGVEIEKKYRLTQERREEILKSLDEIGAEYAGEEFEENILFRGGDLGERNAVLRLRRIGEKTILTFKERRPSQSAVKQHTEFETEVADFTAMRDIFQSIGFYPSMVYEKRRLTHHFRRVEIVLDELPFGFFMEIEGSLTEIAETEMLLGIEDLPDEPLTYPHLTAKFGKQNGNLIEARFGKKI